MKTKREFKYFTIFNHEKEEAYLRSQHQAGWKLVKVTGLGLYSFEECPPEDVVYQLDYNQEGSKNKSEYIAMFADCGWEYIQEFVGYSYFRKPAAQMNGREEIFSDDDSRKAMMERVYKGRMIPLLCLFFAVLLPQFFTNISLGNHMVVILIGIVLGIYIALFAAFAVKYYKLRKK